MVKGYNGKGIHMPNLTELLARCWELVPGRSGLFNLKGYYNLKLKYYTINTAAIDAIIFQFRIQNIFLEEAI